MTVFEYLREHLLGNLGLPAQPIRRLPDLDTLRETEWSPEFEQLCRNRLILGAFRYGRFEDPEKWKSDLIAGAKKKIAAYEDSGNLEHLVDLANYARLEFIRPSRPRAHFRAEDDHKHCPVSVRGR